MKISLIRPAIILKTGKIRCQQEFTGRIQRQNINWYRFLKCTHSLIQEILFRKQPTEILVCMHKKIVKMDSSNFSSGNPASYPFFFQVGSLPINLKPFFLHLKQETNTLTSYPPLQLKSHIPSPFQNKLISNHFDIYLKLSQHKSTIPGCSVGKESACNAGDTGDEGSIPGSGRSLVRGHGNPLQYSCQRMPRTEQPGGLQSIGSQESTNLAYCSLPLFVSWQLHPFNCSGLLDH